MFKKMCYGLAMTDLRCLAYQLALKNEKIYPTMWNNGQIAGKEWLYGFMKRHPNLSLWTTKPTSLSRATSFNKTNVNTFFMN